MTEDKELLDPQEIIERFISAIPDWDPLEPPGPVPPEVREWVVEQVQTRAENQNGHHMEFDFGDVGRAHRKAYAMGLLPNYSAAISQLVYSYLDHLGADEATILSAIRTATRKKQ